ncbi:hypothetical protein J6590_100774 [Homalodisca vitripennis]|nr:hypothetical protein J6590_100774 [Homalodisca vitripennis]
MIENAKQTDTPTVIEKTFTRHQYNSAVFSTYVTVCVHWLTSASCYQTPAGARHSPSLVPHSFSLPLTAVTRVVSRLNTNLIDISRLYIHCVYPCA